MTTDTTKKNYKDTLNLPQTTFAMEAKLVTNEPARLARWKESRLYDKIMSSRANSPKWILHDGPPFANGDIHMGHLLNKVLKDVVMRYKTMAGFQTPYVPGWDCHGLPIEHKISTELGAKAREMSTVEIRQLCHAYAQKYVSIQAEQFQRLGILGEWSNPYLTMAPEYEAEILEVFARFVEAGLVYKQLKPVHWSIANQTALADAELEYKDVEDNSVFVEFPSSDGQLNYLVWTTTPWTLPANMAIAVHPDVEYASVKYLRSGKPRISVVAKDLVAKVFAKVEHQIVATKVGKEFVGATYKHPFIDRVGKIVHAEYVTTTDGTGLVHTAPGHGEDDYHTGLSNKLEIYCPVRGNGTFDDTAPDWLRGINVWKANPIITEKLREKDVLFAEEKIRHSYPHDWRSKTPTIFRATEQWFVAMDKPFSLPTDPVNLAPSTLRQRAVDLVGFDLDDPQTPQQNQLAETLHEWADRQGAMKEHYLKQSVQISSSTHAGSVAPYAEFVKTRQVKFIPRWGRNRLRGMLENRPDWCISRQRSWGLPIPVFYNEKDQPLLTPASVRAVAKHFRQHGSDAWFTCPPATLLGADFKYPPGFSPENLRKEKDIFDVWFESGSSWRSVLQCRSYLKYPADLYLEGSDQHRGWFQLSMLLSLGATGEPAFKEVLTHGFIVKPDGTKVSKSDKEYVTAMQEVDRHGADLLRLYVCSLDYQGDLPTSAQTIKEFGDKYRKIRNTLRYLMSNLYDFDPKRDGQKVPQNSLDGWANAELDALIAEVTDGYESYQLHRVFRSLHDFCSVQISSMYANAMKDRLYCESANSPVRRRSQTVMHRMLIALTKLLAPMLVFTADEAWDQIQQKAEMDCDLPSVHLAHLPKPSGEKISEEQREEWKLLMDLRSSALSQIDVLLRKFPKQIKPLDVEVVYRVDDDSLRRKLQEYGADLEDLVGAGSWSFAEKSTEGPAVSIEVVDRRDTYKACARSWKRRPDVGTDADYPDLTLRDAKAVKSRGV